MPHNCAPGPPDRCRRPSGWRLSDDDTQFPRRRARAGRLAGWVPGAELTGQVWSTSADNEPRRGVRKGLERPVAQGMRVVVKCPDCAELRVGPSDVTVRNCLDDDGWSYRFTCPACRRPVVAPTNRRAAVEAIAAGSSLENWRFPLERNECPDSPPLSLEDLVELHQLLSEPDWFDLF